MYRIAVNLCRNREDSRDTCDRTTVVFDTLQTLFDRFTGCSRCDQKKHMLAFDHWLEVVTEDQLAGAVNLRCNNVDGFVLVHGSDTVLT